MIRGIIFDCFGVLYGSSAEALRSLCAPEQLRDFDDLVKQTDYGYISGEEYVLRLVELFDKDEAEIRAMFKQQRVRNAPLVEFVRTLRPQYKVALLSNVSSNTIEHLISPDEQAQLFDVVVQSCEVQLTKPDPNIFTLTAERLGLAPEECVMIDDREENCQGASRAGMHTVWFATNDQAIGELQRLLHEVN